MLLVDNRERHLAWLLEDICDDIRFSQLPIGDYIVVSSYGAVIIERKIVNDFLYSIRSNRLWDQLLRMMKTDEIFGHPVKRRILMIHGNFEEFFEPFEFDDEHDLIVRWSRLMGAYLEIIYVYNTPIIHAESDMAFKVFMKILVERESSGMNEKLPEAKWYKKPARADLPIKDRKKYILSSIPFIGDRLAENLLTYFRTISDVANASIEELQKVPKIGKKKAELIYRIFHHKRQLF